MKSHIYIKYKLAYHHLLYAKNCICVSILLHSDTGILLSVKTTSSYICDNNKRLAISVGTVATASLHHCNRASLQPPLHCSNAVSLKENPISFALY